MLPPHPDDPRQQKIDESGALGIQLGHHNPAGSEWFGIETFLQFAAGLHERFKVPPGPRTKQAAAQALLKYYQYLQRRADNAPRGTKNELLQSDSVRGMIPWTREKPIHLEQIYPFLPENLRKWQHAAVAPLPTMTQPHTVVRKPTVGSIHTPAAEEAKRFAKANPSGLRGSWSKEIDPNAIILTLVKTPAMGYETKDGEIAILVEILRQLKQDNLTPIEEYLWVAQAVQARYDLKPPADEQLSKAIENFNKKPVGAPFTVTIYKPFIALVSEYLQLSYPVRNLEEQKPRYLAALEQKLKTLDPESNDYKRVQREIKSLQPNKHYHELYSMLSVEQRLLYAATSIHDGLRLLYTPSQPYKPGNVYGNGALFVHYAGGPNEQVWLMPDGRLYKLNERELRLDSFIKGVLTARGIVILGYALMVATPLIILAPEIMAWFVPKLGAILRAGPAALRAAPGAIKIAPSALRLCLYQQCPRLLAWAGFGFNLSINTAENGVDEFLAQLKTPKGAALFILDVMMTHFEGKLGRMELEDSVPTSKPGQKSQSSEPDINLSGQSRIGNEPPGESGLNPAQQLSRQEPEINLPSKSRSAFERPPTGRPTKVARGLAEPENSPLQKKPPDVPQKRARGLENAPEPMPSSRNGKRQLARQSEPIATNRPKGDVKTDVPTHQHVPNRPKGSKEQLNVLEFDENGLPRQLNLDHGAHTFEVPPFKTEIEARKAADEIYKQRSLTSKSAKKPHVLGVEVYENDNKIGQWWEVSEKTPRKILQKSKKWSKIGDTEQKALSRMNLNSDVRIEMTGTHLPCTAGKVGCLKAIGVAIEQSGATILYDFMQFNPKTGKFSSTLKEYPEDLPKEAFKGWSEKKKSQKKNDRD